MWLRDSTGSPVMAGPFNIPQWDFRIEEARQMWILGQQVALWVYPWCPQEPLALSPPVPVEPVESSWTEPIGCPWQAVRTRPVGSPRCWQGGEVVADWFPG